MRHNKVETLSSRGKTVRQIELLPFSRKATPVSGETRPQNTFFCASLVAGKANRTSNIQDKIQDINSTAETMQTNMSSLTDLDMLDQFTKPQSNGAVLQIFIVLSNA